MATILVVYTNSKVDNKSANKMEYYAFKADKEVVQVGDMLKSDEYKTAMQVIKVIDTDYQYHNMITGELSNEFTSTSQREIRTLVIITEVADVVYAVRIKED